MDKFIVYFHSADFDGICGGKVVEKYITETFGHPPKMRPINYGEPHDLTADLAQHYRVYMVDFSLPPDEMLMVKKYAKEFVWLDHHETAINDSKLHGYDDLMGLRNTKYAGCELAWDYLFPKTRMPYSVHLFGRYDVWDHSNPDALSLQYGARYMLGKMDRDKFWEAMTSDIQVDPGMDGSSNRLNMTDGSSEHMMVFLEAITIGKVIHEYQTSSDAKVAKSICYEVEFEGYKFIAANRSHCNSNFFNSVYNPEVHDGMLRFNKLRDNGNWSVSLYTTKDIALNEVAKKYGGGGHRQACGFQLTTDQIHKVMP